MSKKNRTTITLEEPIERGNDKIPEFQLRRPQSGELRGLSLRAVLDMEVDALIKLTPRISAPALTEQEVAELCPADLTQIGIEVANFFMTAEQKASLSA